MCAKILIMNRIHRNWVSASAAFCLLGGVVALKAVTEPRNDFRFSIIGDRTGGAQPQIYGRIWREVDLLHPDFVINVGDTIEGGNDQRAQPEWDAMRPLFERYKHFPLYFTPGNHDVWNDSSRRIYEKESGRASFYSFDYQQTHFTVLDNSRTNELTKDQLDFLAADLEANKDKSPKLIFFHRPFWIAYLKFKSGEFPLHQLALKYGVSAVISGHGHQFVRLLRDRVVYMEVGSSGGNMTKGLLRGEGFREGWFYHHVWGQVKGGKINFTVKEIDGAFGKGRIFKAEDWDENGPKFDSGDPAVTEKPAT